MIRSAGIGAPSRSPQRDRLWRLISEVFVTIRYGIARASSSASASPAPGSELALEDDHAVEVEEQGADAGEGVANGVVERGRAAASRWSSAR